jgi:hypothetical protein
MNTARAKSVHGLVAPTWPDGSCRWHAGARTGRCRHADGRRGGAPPGGLSLAALRQGLHHDDEGTEQGEEGGVSLMAWGDSEVRSRAVSVVLTGSGALRRSTATSGSPCSKVRRRGR